MSKHFSQSYDPIKLTVSQAIFTAINAIKDETVLVFESSDEIFDLLEIPPESALGDYAFPCFRLAKVLRQNPNKIANAIKDHIEGLNHNLIDHCQVKGAFLNFYLKTDQLAQILIPSIADKSYFNSLKQHNSSSERVMIEFSQPNTHKEFHVGHTRNVCLGDSLSKIYAYNGYHVTPVNYIGDEGTHVAKCLWQVQTQKCEGLAEKPYAQWYGQMYVKANSLLADADSEQKISYQAAISKVLADIERKEGKTYELWQQSRSECMEDFNDIYESLDIPFDHIFYESEVSEDSQKIVDEYIDKGLFTESEGAIGVSLKDQGLGYFMARKSDGTSLYITKDLALAKKKFQDFKIDRSIYVVGNEQDFHFKQLFSTLKLMGFEQAEKCYHLSYAHVKLKEGKISSRKGNAFTFKQLEKTIATELDGILAKYQDQWSQEEIDATIKALTVSAVKYGMLNADPQKEIVFDPKTWVSFEGNSGPYLAYSYARTCSILRKCSEQGYHANEKSLHHLKHKLEHDLMRNLYEFNNVCKSSCRQYKPSNLTNYLFSLCKAFNRFYAEQSVMNAKEGEREARIALTEAFSSVLFKGLGLLGIKPPSRM